MMSEPPVSGPQPTVLHGNAYDFPKYYDVLFSASYQAEHDFLLNCFEHYVTPTVKTVFEPACGTGRLLWRLGKLGYKVSGLDLNAKALKYCNDRLRRHGLAETAFFGDMCDFKLPSRVDAAFNLVGSFSHLVAPDTPERHLRAMAAAIRPGGIYVIGFHLKPKGEPECQTEKWTVRHGSLLIESEIGPVAQDWKKGVEELEFRIMATTPSKKVLLVDRFEYRMWTHRRFAALLKRTSCFELVQTNTFDFDFEHPKPIDANSEDVVYVLRRL